ncbi:PepSY domain-containing protein [Rhodoferax sp.]|uniref:PepSY domain-containing protein n=1 Tax=Rhodoferax sp. TaxID=50421 RepID=UPI00284EC0B7|nr:PepSY domain-containing protein [Rhodoferax sp.]MDR3371275.1 peptidase [Rhodoferax sp.]
MKFLNALTAALLITLTLPAWADVSRDAAAAAVQKSSGGRVLAVDRIDQGGRVVWRVKVLTQQGEVKVILVDAASGRTM